MCVFWRANKSPLCLSAHVLAGEWIRKPDGRVSCEDEGWVTVHSHMTSYFLHSVILCFWSLSCLYFRSRWLRTALRRRPVWGKKHSPQPRSLFPVFFFLPSQLFVIPSGPDALRPATLEATRPSGGQQQADLGQWGVHLYASGHRTAVNQGQWTPERGFSVLAKTC